MLHGRVGRRRRPERIVGVGLSVDPYRKRVACGVRRPASAFTCGVGIDIDFRRRGRLRLCDAWSQLARQD